MIMIARHIDNLDAQTTHLLEDAINRQEVLYAPLIVLLVAPTCTGEVTHQDDSIQLRALRERLEHCVQEWPPGMNIADDPKDCAQRTGFICIRP